ncbi:MAG: hypothetical protein H6523_12825 [Mycolicibacterium sp.]|nr:hypothetical protein [Mycolicibacterium sp.]
MTGVDQPPTGFGYSYWFICTGCGRRVEIDADLYELQCTCQAEHSVCACGTPIDITEETPTLCDVDDVALCNDSAAGLVWYHSSRHGSWPDRDAYAAEVAEVANPTESRSGDMFDPIGYVERKLSLAVHLGSYEAAIENILRRLEDQDRSDIFSTRYWLHRVEIVLDRPGDLHPEVNNEFRTVMGDVELTELHGLGARAVRYVNLHEAIGSVSLAIDPAVVGTVSTIELPVVEAALPETAAARSAVAKMESGPAPSGWGSPGWSEFVETLQSEYLAGVNPQVRERFPRALGNCESPEEFHRRFRVVAGLLMRPGVVVELLAAAPRRGVSGG